MGWIIEHETERDDETGAALLWSHSEGWTAGDDFETFTDDEREAFDLPIGGEWRRVSWNAAAVPFVDVCEETAYGRKTRLPFQIRVF
jgi:hypothetical protein